MLVFKHYHMMGKSFCAEVNFDRLFEHTISNSAGKQLNFRAVFETNWNAQVPCVTPPANSPSQDGDTTQDMAIVEAQQRVLIIFIRHFFCGNCQEYLRCLASSPILSPVNLTKHNIRIAIIGCGSPSLIESYRAIADIPQSWQLFADPSTKAYQILGMRRTLSLGDRSPRYIRRSLTGNMLRSIVQGIRRIPQGDVLAAGGWDVNGGEFLFESDHSDQLSHCNYKWRLKWCHRMLNSRDHTELEELLVVLGLVQTAKTETSTPNSALKIHARSQSTPIFSGNSLYLDEQSYSTSGKRRPGMRRSLSARRQSWMNKTSSFARSMSLRVASST